MRRGFTLVEIMIVVAIIALLAAIAIPNLLGARRTANEAAAKANIRTLATELETYASGTGDGAYPADVAALAAVPSAAALKYCTAGVPCTTAGTGCGGYVFSCVVASTGYTLIATPLSAQTGSKVYQGTSGGQFTESAYVAP